MAFSVTSRQPPQKCSLDFDKNDWAGCHPSFGFLMWKCWGFLQLFYAPTVGLKNPSWVSLATISLGVLCYDWPGCKYLANENALNKNKFFMTLEKYSSVYFIVYYYNIVTFVSLLLGWVLTDWLCQFDIVWHQFIKYIRIQQSSYIYIN